MQQSINNVLFHEKTITPSTGLELSINGLTTINIEFETLGTFSAIFEAKASDETTIWKPYVSCNMATLDVSPTATDKNYIYQIDTTAISKLRVKLTSVSGEISVYGKCVG